MFVRTLLAALSDLNTYFEWIKVVSKKCDDVFF